MKASEAQLIAKGKGLSDFYKTLHKVMQQIEMHANHGHFEVQYYESVSPKVEKHLLDLGYGLEKDEYFTKISWR